MAEKIIGMSVIADEEIYLQQDLVMKGDKGDIYVPIIDNDKSSPDYGTLAWELRDDPPEEEIATVNLVGPEGKVFVPSVDGDGNISWALDYSPTTPEIANIRGPQGFTGTLSIGTVTTGDPNTEVKIDNVGTPENAVLNIAIPQGKKGDKGDRGERGLQGVSGTLQIGKVETLESGESVAIVNIGTAENAILNVSIPKGDRGDKGEQGNGLLILGSYDTVEQLEVAHPTGQVGDSYMVNSTIYNWNNETQKWKSAGEIRGPEGPAGPQGEPGKSMTYESMSESEKNDLINAVTNQMGGSLEGYATIEYVNSMMTVDNTTEV